MYVMVSFISYSIVPISRIYLNLSHTTSNITYMCKRRNHDPDSSYKIDTPWLK